MRKRDITRVGIKIKKRLAELNMTQRQLAEILGISETYLHQIIYGYRKGKKCVTRIEKVLEEKVKEIA